MSLVLGAAAVLPGAGDTSSAAFPGRNGLIAFQSFRDGYSQIYVMTDRPTQPTKLSRQRPSCYALPAWSRDGKQIAFEFNPDREGRPSSRSDIYVMNADGTGQRNLTIALPGFNGDASFSPDGRYVVFENLRNGNSDIYTVAVRSRRPRRLTSNSAADEDPAWSPDGKRIAFTSARNGGNREIYVMDRTGDGRSNPARNVTRNKASDRNPSWSPRGDVVAFDSDRDRNFEIYSTNGRAPARRLTNHPGLDALPAWSPDGRSIVFVSDRDEPGNRDLYVMRSSGSSVRKLTESPAWDVAPDWGSAPLRTIGRPPTALPPPGPRGDASSAIACVVR